MLPPQTCPPRPGSGRTAGGHFLSIQALRGAAAILVVMFHAGLRFDPSERTFRLGNAGVDIFFVISGFVMWVVATRRPTTPGVFLLHRFIRLVPLYWAFTLLMVALALMIPAQFPRLMLTPAHIGWSLVFVPHAAPPKGHIGPVLGQGWTLNFEVLFYLLFSGVLFLPARQRLAALAAALVALVGLGFVVATPHLPVTTLLSPLLLEFLLGLLLARLFQGGRCVPISLCWGALAAGVLLLLLGSPGAADDLARTIQYGVPAALIVFGLVGLEIAGRLRLPVLVLLLGDASYSIYLSHTFMISVLGKIWPADLPPIAFILVVTPAAVAGGVVVYWCGERRILAGLRYLTGQTRRRFEAPAGAGAA
jgi:exopolysaccharide production protein ExoZ